MTKLTRITALTIVAMLTPFALAQADERQYSPNELRVELALERAVYYPTQPIPVRFTIFNPSEKAADLPGAGISEGVSLSRGVIIGDEHSPALWISYDNEPPVAIQPGALATPGDCGVLRLAPNGVVGARVLLNDLYRQVRYSGTYRLEWRPLGGAVPPAAATFRVETRKDAVLVTDHGKITFSLDYDKAPRNVENFIGLVREKFYDQKTVHRIIPSFIIQGGSPDGTSKGVHPDGRLVEAEFHDAPFEMGTLAMARKPNDPDSASCQFFISLGRLANLDGQFTIIGQARDEESLRTLRLLADLPTDANDRPLRPLSIRVLTLVDIPEYKTENVGMTRP